MAQDESGAVAALSALLGYVGAEAATTTPFEHLFWPQRHLSNFSWHDALAAALLLPMGGPLHKAALSTFDTLHQHGIFKGARRGHMLGTAFFSDLQWSYVMYRDGVGGEQKAARNCFWATAMGMLDVQAAHGITESRMRSVEEGRKTPSKAEAVVRAHISTFHLRFARATLDDKTSAMPFVREDLRTPGLRVFLALLAAESSAIIMAIILAVVWRTYWVILWLIPIILRLAGALTALHREPLETIAPTEEEEKKAEESCDCELLCPQSNGDFMVFSGPPSIIQQFMRHYGHPVRSRPREITQLAIVVAIGCVFPAGLVASSLFMPLHLQYAWFGYQIFLVAGLHFARYSRYTRRFSTNAAVSQAFERQDPVAGASVLFGHERRGAGTLRVDLAVTSHSKHAEGKKAVQALLQRRSYGAPRSPGSDKA